MLNIECIENMNIDIFYEYIRPRDAKEVFNDVNRSNRLDWP